ATHDFDWISRNIPEGLDARLIDITSHNAVFSLMGPRARDVLQTLTQDDVSNAGFPFGACRMIALAGAPVLALRVTYVGELGWELHIPVEFATSVCDRLMQGGTPHGIANAGYRAIESLRLEKAYRAWGSDIGPEHTPSMAGLGWAVKLRKSTPFLGREALEEEQKKPLPRLLAGFTVDDPGIVLLGRETIFRNGKRVGWLASAGWGYTLKTNVGLGYVRDSAGVDADYVMSGECELELATERVAAKPFLKPLYDPDMKRIKA